ncbi:MAG TPA: hypothetical protein VKB42_16630 [Dongiaceae bacterium]|jgi:hypothetical protein|nr:hypothetical protein [Dongiaceae bacterium]
MNQTQPAGSDHKSGLPDNFIYAGAVGVMGVVALFLAARAGHGAAYSGGLTFFAFAVLFIFLMIKRGFDKSEGIRSGGLPLFVRVAAAVAFGYLLYGIVADQAPDQATLVGVIAAVVVFALLAIIDRIAIRAE